MKTGSTFVKNSSQSVGQPRLGQTIGQLPPGRDPFAFGLVLLSPGTSTNTALERSDGHSDPFVFGHRTVLLEMVKERFAISIQDNFHVIFPKLGHIDPIGVAIKDVTPVGPKIVGQPNGIAGRLGPLLQRSRGTLVSPTESSSPSY